MTSEAVVHGVEWTVKELFVYPNEFIYWSIQIVMYPYMTGLVAGAFVLSSLYHVFGQKDLKDIAQFSLVFSLALLPVAALPLLLHLQQPLRAMEPKRSSLNAWHCNLCCNPSVSCNSSSRRTA